jgi:heme-degrading monooxygenase HmoA
MRETPMPTMFVNCFEVPAGRDEQFLSLFREVNTYMQAKPGYLSHRLHRSLAPDARYRFVNYAVWASPEAWRAAHDDGFRALVTQAAWKDFTTTNALYEVIHEGGAQNVTA